MRDLLPALHNTHDSGLCLEIPIRSDSFVGLLVFCLRFFGLYLVDLDAVFWV